MSKGTKIDTYNAQKLYNKQAVNHSIHADWYMIYSLLELPSYSRMENKIKDYIINRCILMGFNYYTDDYGNLYVDNMKKVSEKNTLMLPCVVAHIDTAQKEHIGFIISDSKLEPKFKVKDEKLRAYGNGYGLGGDDKCGIIIALTLLEKIRNLKCVFFVQEELGNKGSEHLDSEFFKNVGYVISFDSPEYNRAAYACDKNRLFPKTFFENIQDICRRHGVTEFKSEPSTDVKAIRERVDVVCMNFGSGYYKQHTISEYIILDELNKALNLGKNLILNLDYTKYYYRKHTNYAYNSFLYLKRHYKYFLKKAKTIF